ncbi:hypothetical protein EUAN_24150 [Andreesenia angusta]|uniref:Bacteriocin n=1 Tax=Andreesenia angusta TaxID=39480 RepID=A0A1S1V3N6_9FIRM|nr:hypothetical protein [Andreesenia angusta]OHW61222.1 hypothetical protein EUAN_24150 [Andreesenia angusta]
MKIKKFGSLVLASAILTISASSVSLGAHLKEAGVTEIGINVDNPIMKNYSTSQKSNSNVSIMSSTIHVGEKVSVAGGTLWAEFQGAKHRAKYDHSSKEHRSSATNGAGHILRSSWVKPGHRATTEWCSSTITGNKVFGATK